MGRDTKCSTKIVGGKQALELKLLKRDWRK